MEVSGAESQSSLHKFTQDVCWDFTFKCDNVCVFKSATQGEITTKVTFTESFQERVPETRSMKEREGGGDLRVGGGTKEVSYGEP